MRAHPLQHLMDVDRAARQRLVVGKRLHAVDQRDDAVGLVADQLGQLAAGIVGVLLQQLRGAADAGKRVLDLMRQHRRHRGHRARRVAMARTGGPSARRSPARAATAPEGRPPPRPARPGSSPAAAESRGPSSSTSYSAIEPPSRHTASTSPKSGLCGTMKSAEMRAVQRRRADAEKLFGRRVDKAHRAAAVERDDRVGQRGEQHARDRRPGAAAANAAGHRHAASRSTSGS